MPSLKEAMSADLSGYSPVMASSPQVSSAPTVETQPGLNSMIRCPLPTFWQAAPDSLRQFYQGGQVPQTRILSPNPVPTFGKGGTTVTKVSVIQSVTTGTSSTGTTSSTSAPTGAQQAVVTTASINPGRSFQGVLTTSRSLQLLSLSVSSPCRVQLYGTASAQSNDMQRGIDQPPGAGTAQNIICDVVLDTAPYQWSFQNRVGANADSPQQPLVYVTITNLDAMSDVVTLTLQYVILEA